MLGRVPIAVAPIAALILMLSLSSRADVRNGNFALPIEKVTPGMANGATATVLGHIKKRCRTLSVNRRWPAPACAAPGFSSRAKLTDHSKREDGMAAIESGFSDAAMPPRAAPGGVEPPFSVVLGQRLQWLRRARGLSHEIVAARLGRMVEHIERHEARAVRIEARELIACARPFRVRISAFFADPPAHGSA